MSEEKLPIDFTTLVESTRKSFRDLNLYYIVGTYSVLASHYGYYLNVDTADVIYAHYDISISLKEPPRSIYITLVLKYKIAVKIAVDRDKDSNEIANVRVWVMPLE